MNRPSIMKGFGRIALSLLLVGAIGLLSACGQATPSTSNPVEQTRGLREASLVLRPYILSGKFKILAVVENYTKSSVNHLVIKIFQLNGQTEQPLLDSNGNQVMADLAKNQLEQPITFHHLYINTVYRVRAYAYKAPGTAPSDLISTEDGSSPF